ncbi:response regulator [Acidobacteriota bacterium]
MSIVTIFNASFSREIEVSQGIARELGYRHVSKELLEKASGQSGLPSAKLDRALHGKPSIFNRFTREKEKNIAQIKLTLGEIIKDDNLVYYGFAALLLPKRITHVLRVCLNASQAFRIATAMESGQFESENEARNKIRKDDKEIAQWAEFTHGLSPWERSLFDIKLPMHSTTVEEAVRLVCEHARSDVVKTNSISSQALDDYILASRVNLALAEEGHFDIDVTSDEGEVTVFINKHILRLHHLENELRSIAIEVPGVNNLTIKVGADFYKADIYRKQTFEVPKKVLLVDDESEFVQTLSERLQMREFGTAVALNGEEAMAMVESDEPEVIILDLRMPGIDGIEVLRRLKQQHPEIEVIILTGHGTDKDRQISMELGAFAYLEKPVDIDKLSETMKAAYGAIRRKKNSGRQDD